MRRLNFVSFQSIPVGSPDTITIAADCFPLISPPSFSAASNAAIMRSARSPSVFRNAFAIAFGTVDLSIRLA